MTTHLLLVTLGPVQEFIAEARRTRDLWYGSHLLSEIGRAAARTLVDQGADLIFPSFEKGDPELQPCSGPLRPSGKPPRNIANKLLAEVPPTVDPQRLARTVREEVMRFWRDDLAAPVKTRCAGILASDTDSVWDEQVDTFLEFAACWLPLDGYVQTRRRLEQAIAGRKLLRDFHSWTHGRGAVPKSSLDGARETLLRPPASRQPDLVRKYRIAEGEQLDAVGLVKRAGGEPDQFVPLINVALASWVKLADRASGDGLENLRKATGDIGVSRVARRDLPCVEPFPFDASVLLPSRWRSVFEEQGLEGDAQMWGQKHVQPILRRMSEPYPYVACLVADGDHVGGSIDQLSSKDDLSAFSMALANFAGEARRAIEQDHLGSLVYAGGDDILAFLPLPEALPCAEHLRERFEVAMASACQSIPVAKRPTMSVGLGIGHIMEGMGDLLALGRQAESEAKRDRNALAVVVDKRSGGTRTWRAQWSDNDNPVRLLDDARNLLQERFPSGKVYEIAATLARLPRPDEVSEQVWARVLILEVQRSLSRVESGALSAEDVGLMLDEEARYAVLHSRVCDWVSRMLIARTFAQAIPRDQLGIGGAAA